MRLTICAVLTIAAAAATSAAAQPEQRSHTGGRFYMDIGGHNQGYLSRADSGGTATLDDKHNPVPSAVEGNQIEILSWSWGESAASAPAASAKFGAVSGMHRADGLAGAPDKITVGGGTTGTARLPGKRTPPTVTLKRGSSSASNEENGGTEDINIGVGELQAPAEKRQHGWVTLPMPLDRGAVRIKVKYPWVGCAVGARYPKLTLGGDRTYELSDAIVTGCASASGAAEEVSFNYAKVQVRGWDPAAKQE